MPPPGPPYEKTPASCHFFRFAQCFSWTGPLTVSFEFMLPKPFSLVPIGWLCQAEKFSSCTHEIQPVVKPHLAAPDSMIFLE